MDSIDTRSRRATCSTARAVVAVVVGPRYEGDPERRRIAVATDHNILAHTDKSGARGLATSAASDMLGLRVAERIFFIGATVFGVVVPISLVLVMLWYVIN